MPPRPILKGLPNLSTFSRSSFSSESDNSPIMFSPNGTSNAFPFTFSNIPSLASPHVHFPPTPTLTRTALTHSPFSYDRRSIIVTPNICELPRRGEREVEEDYFQPHMYHSPTTASFSFTESDSSPREPIKRPTSAGGIPPRHRRTRSQTISIPYPSTSFPSGALANNSSSYPNPSQASRTASGEGLPVPSLVSDTSSDPSSSESDGSCGTPPEANASVYAGDTRSATNRLLPTEAGSDALSGLPHISVHFHGGLSLRPGEVSTHEYGSEKTAVSIGEEGKNLLWRPKLRRLPVRSRTLDCIHDATEGELDITNGNALGSLFLVEKPVSSEKPKRSCKVRTKKPLYQDTSSGGFDDSSLDGCLGGF